jgi:phosphohistidine swiveling domain-containing protein
MIYEPQEYARLGERIPKAGVLSDLFVANFPVPPFVVITQDEFAAGVSSSCIEIIVAKLPVSRYAIRFASGSEDRETDSAAGRFHSVIGVPQEALEDSINEVLTKSVPLTRGAPYVLIIQQAVVADMSGVIFSRDPFNSRYLQLEQGSGTSSVVSGDTDTETSQFLIGRPVSSSSPSYVAKLVELATIIERWFDFPQDIEWCVHDSHVSLVQSRPISTYTKADWLGIKLIDRAVAGKATVHWKQSEGMETYGHPTPLDFSILNFLHAPGGAVAAAYSRLGLRYTATNQYILLGNTLYVDTEKEQQQLLPSYALVGPKEYRLRYLPLAKLITTASNQAQLKKSISPRVLIDIVNELRAQLSAAVPVMETASQVLTLLTTQYQTIFLINHLVRRSGVESAVEADITLEQSIRQLRQQLPDDLVPGVTRGNSLAIADESVFAVAKFSQSSLTDELREVARWQSVRLRASMEQTFRRILAERTCEESLGHFFPVDSWLQNSFDRQAAERERENYQKMHNVSFPETISTFELKEDDNEMKVLAPGTARGVLVASLTSVSSLEKPILYTDTLSPQIIPHLANVSGVICRYGGVLAHAAIVARELGIPVIKTRTNFQDNIGDIVSLHAYPAEEVQIRFEENN